MSSQTIKMALRSQILSLRHQHSLCPKSATLFPRIITNISDLIGTSYKISIMAGYYPIKDEFNVLPILDHFRTNERCEIALPTTGPKHSPLTFVHWPNMNPKLLKRGKYGIPVPSVTPQRILLPQVILVPLVGFTKGCARLGYGGGYYDKTIRELRKTKRLHIAIGIAYEVQRCDTIPWEDTDEFLDAVVTDEKVYLKDTEKEEKNGKATHFPKLSL